MARASLSTGNGPADHGQPQRRARGSVIIHDYDSGWPRAYEAERARVEAILGDLVLAIHHIGSTAVPSLAAKPIIDILVELRTLDLPKERIAAMEQLGYEYRGEYGIPGRRYFSDRNRRHIHAFLAGHPKVEEHLVFRDYLRAHPAEAARYATLKRELAGRFQDDPTAYQEAKRPFIEAAIERARIWRGR